MESSNRNFYIIGLLVLLLIGLFMIPISGLLLDPAPTPNYLDTPLEELNNYSLRQVYGESLYLNEDIQPLNNHTLREVFEGGNLLDTTISLYSGSITAPDIVDNIYTLINDGSLLTRIFFINQPNKIIGNTYYIYSNMRHSKINGSYALLFTDDVPLLLPIINTNYNFISHKFTANNTNNVIQFAITDIDNFGGEIQIEPLGYINLTSLGISALTIEQMDFWFNLYEDIKVSNLRSNAIEYGIYSRDTFVQNMNRFGLENTSLAKLNYYYDLYQYYISFELD